MLKDFPFESDHIVCHWTLIGIGALTKLDYNLCLWINKKWDWSASNRESLKYIVFKLTPATVFAHLSLCSSKDPSDSYSFYSSPMSFREINLLWKEWTLYSIQKLYRKKSGKEFLCKRVIETQWLFKGLKTKRLLCYFAYLVFSSFCEKSTYKRSKIDPKNTIADNRIQLLSCMRRLLNRICPAGQERQQRSIVRNFLPQMRKLNIRLGRKDYRAKKWPSSDFIKMLWLEIFLTDLKLKDKLRVHDYLLFGELLVTIAI